eukprot:492341-Rhodomonas_salina.1
MGPGVGGVVKLDLVVKATSENALSLWQGGALDLVKAITVPQPSHLSLLCTEPKRLQAGVEHGCIAVLQVWLQTINVCQCVPVSHGVAECCPDTVELIISEGAWCLHAASVHTGSNLKLWHCSRLNVT